MQGINVESVSQEVEIIGNDVYDNNYDMNFYGNNGFLISENNVYNNRYYGIYSASVCDNFMASSNPYMIMVIEVFTLLIPKILHYLIIPFSRIKEMELYERN